ncbi:unnamed protein product [Linum tenue]|uniref:Uncharacterized protein n=2 Tax=Linum tenue TaxID=586396 RepID=A0AAV0J3W6_9ROSI|nr:unnamed protein product [Linum tenue]
MIWWFQFHLHDELYWHSCFLLCRWLPLKEWLCCIFMATNACCTKPGTCRKGSSMCFDPMWPLLEP